MGVGAIKADFGEGAPLNGRLRTPAARVGTSTTSIPLRYNKAVCDVTKEITGEDIIWARSAWAGSQRYPLHWGGDAENTDIRDGGRAARRAVVRPLAASRTGATTWAAS